MGLYLVNLVLLLSVNLSNKVMTVKHFMHLKLLKLCLALSAYLSAHRPPFFTGFPPSKRLSSWLFIRRETHMRLKLSLPSSFLSCYKAIFVVN